MTEIDRDRQEWVDAVVRGETKLGLDAWLKSGDSLPGDNVTILVAGRYPMVRVQGTWLKITSDGVAVKASPEDVAERLSDADAVIDRNVTVIRGKVNQ